MKASTAVFRFLVLTTYIFIFSAFPLLGILFGTTTQKTSTAYAGDGRNILANESWRKDLGLEQCPDMTKNKLGVFYCKDIGWVFDCMLRDMSHDPGKSEGDAWGKGDCAAGEEVSWDLWAANAKGMRDQTINSCHTCMDNCWFDIFSQAKGEDYRQEMENSCTDFCKPHLPGDSFNVYKEDSVPNRTKASCMLTSWSDAWYGEQYPTTSDAITSKACDLGCAALKNADGGDKEPPNCPVECKNRHDPEKARQYLLTHGANQQGLINKANREINAGLTQFIYGVIPPVSFGQIPGGFGCNPVQDPAYPNDPTKKICQGGVTNVKGFMADVWSIGSVLFGSLAILKIVFGGVMYATAAGNPQRISSAKGHILYALLGVGLIILVNLILTILGVGPDGLLPTH